MTYKVKKIVIITEKLIAEGVTRIIEECGATGYTIVAASGKGSRNIRSAERASVVDALTNVQIEAITAGEDMANEIAEKVVSQYFVHYSGIVYLEDVEILRLQKFEKH